MTSSSDRRDGTPKRRRKRVTTFASRRTLRFSEDEERAVEKTRKAIAASSGRPLDAVSFSEALRHIVLTKSSRTTAEAGGNASARPGKSSDWDLGQISDRLGYEIAPIRNYLALISGNLDLVAKSLHMGDPVTAAAVSEALEGVATMKGIPDEIERRIFILTEHGLPKRGTV